MRSVPPASPARESSRTRCWPGSARSLYRVCLYASCAYFTAAAGLLWLRGISTPPVAAELSPSKGGPLLCAPVRSPRSLLVEIPFTRSDIVALELTVALWERHWPCYTLRSPSRPDLLVGFNGNISASAHAGLRARLYALLARRVVRECFGRVTVESAYLTGVEDTYDKRRRDANWTLGPNNLFVHFLEVAAWRGYRYMAQLEPDVLPLRPLWLEQMHCLAATSSAWVLGSPFLGLCARDAHSRRCEELGDDIKFHINGNALYATGDATFRSYWTRAFAGQLSFWPFDLALHLYIQTLPAAAQRRLATKFRHHPFILNFGGEALTGESAAAAVAAAAATSDANAAAAAGGISSLAAESSDLLEEDSAADGVLPMVRRACRHSYLLHSSWAMAQLRTRGGQGLATLGVAPPGIGLADSDAAGVLSSSAKGVARGKAEDGLIALARQRADSDGRLILTFATALYDPLCRNFVSHLRRLGVRSYLLATFTRAYHDSLAARGEQPYLHELAELSSNGSDVFASRDFFLINSARYTVLTRLLRAGLHIFSCDLDVALLRDPLPTVWALPHDLLLQSDARDAITLTESSPFLLRDRLHLHADSEAVTYVNGGVFFARGTNAVARLFEDTWAMASEDLGSLNEQDCLNRMLLRSSLRWAPLPPRLFPNGFVYFRRPLPPKLPHTDDEDERGYEHSQATGAERPVLVHCNWINGISAKRYVLREALVWAGDAEEGGAVDGGGAGGDVDSGGKLLSYIVGMAADERTLGGQVRALSAALALAVLSNRTLVMPFFYILPGRTNSSAHRVTGSGANRLGSDGTSLLKAPLPQLAAIEAREAQAEGRRGFTYMFEYGPMLRQFPKHRESSVLRARWGTRQLPEPQLLPSASAGLDEDEASDSVAVAEGDANGAGAHEVKWRVADATPIASRELRQWLREREGDELLRLRELHRIPMGAIFAHGAQRALFEARLRLALQPAPELRAISHHIVNKIHAHLHHPTGLGRSQARSASSKDRVERKPRFGGGLSGLKQLNPDALPGFGAGGVGTSSAALGAGSLAHSSHDFNCLHVTASDLASPNRLRSAAGSLPLDAPTLLVKEMGMDEATVGGELTWMRDPLPPAALKIFAVPLHVGDFFPYWDAVEVHDIGAGRTLAYDLVQQLVCSAARRIHGNAGSEYVHGVCHWRRSALFSKLHASRRGSSDDVCSTLFEA